MENSPKKKKNSLMSLVIYGLVILLIGVGIYYIFKTDDEDKKISYTEFQTQVYEGKIAEIDVYGYTVKIRYVDGVSADKFPNSMDAYCTYLSINQLTTLVDEYNASLYEDDGSGGKVLKAGAILLDASYAIQTQSWWASFAPYLSIIVMLVISFILFKLMAGGGKGFGFSKSRAKLVISSNVKFANVAGSDEEKQELREIVEFLKNPSRFTEVGARIPKGVLLVGPPGTGKTMLAKAVAGESKVPFFSISGSDFVELYVGVGASRVRELFSNAKANSPCIIFIDEIDAVGRQRGAGMGGGNDEREQTLNQLLVEMDGFETNSGIIILAATNRADILDPALTRPGRFDRQIYVHMPDVKAREEIIKVHAKNKPISEDVDFKRLARLTSGLSGADIENVLNEGALLCARDHRYKITMIDIQEGINKVLMGPKKTSRLITEQDKHITAIHEAGHAIIAQSLVNCDNVQEISIMPRGNAGGYTLTFDEKDRTHLSKQKLLDTITMMLGGRTAEELMLDDITTGASNDIERASKVARKMVAEWGMGNALGLMSVGDGGEIFVGRDYQRQLDYSQALASKIDEEVKSIIEKAHIEAKKILSDKKDLIKKVETILMDKETIYKEEFELLYNGASVEEVEAEIDKKEEEKRIYQERAKQESIEEHKIRSLKLRLETAEALYKTEQITRHDFEELKKSTEAEMTRLEKESKEIQERLDNSSNKSQVVQNDTDKKDDSEDLSEENKKPINKENSSNKKTK